MRKSTKKPYMKRPQLPRAPQQQYCGRQPRKRRGGVCRSRTNIMPFLHATSISRVLKTFGAIASAVMGQVLDKLQGEERRQMQMRIITDRVFDAVKNESGRANLKFEDLYIAVLIVYNDINKLLPVTHIDPPSKERVKEIMKKCDINLDGEIDRNEFYDFIKRITADTVTIVSKRLILTFAVAPTIAMITKKATERIPGVGKVVQKLPNSVYAPLVTLAVWWYQRRKLG